MDTPDVDAIAEEAWQLDFDPDKPGKVTREAYTWWTQHILRAAENRGFELVKTEVTA